MPLPLSKIRSIKMINFIETILYILENITEEKFWFGIFGERLTKICQRYFGNDFIMLGILFYIAPILKTQWQTLVDICMDRISKRSKTVSVRIYYREAAYNPINSFILKNTEQLPGLSDAIAMYESSNSDDEDELPKLGVYPRNNTSNEIEYKGHKLTVSNCNDDEETTCSNKPSYWNISMEASPGESIDTLKQFLQEWCDEYNNSEDNTIKILRWDGYESWVYKDSIEPRAYESVNLPYGVKENVLADMQRFIKRRDWYRRKGIPHRRGFLLYGSPGTGKSSLIQALAGKLQFDLAMIKLSEVHSDSDFSEMMRVIPKDTIMVLEDVDHYDETDKGEMHVTKSGLLNGLDGINGNDGAMIFMTCNDINKLTPALLRPGRMDVKLELGYAVHEQVEAMFWRFFGDNDYGYEDDDNTSSTANDSLALTTKKTDMDELPPTPPNDDEQERKIYLESCLKRLLTLIPENQVTTAELQNLFVTLFLETQTNKMEEKDLLEELFDRVPAFLERIREDREQALIHSGKDIKKDEDSDKDDDSDKEDDDSDKKDDDSDNKDDDSDKKDDDSDKKDDDSDKKDDDSDKKDDDSDKKDDDSDKK
ncbi:P-loop containing nucleoside triphosphate hydrolase protein, partial [Halteromyces radiatus]|uniref:P-loop containing nucleoside triphosphate hydrolase protein n=1 Tax=Halteromyces radiatus TaxID=101107 RepID=UPI00221EB5C5